MPITNRVWGEKALYPTISSSVLLQTGVVLSLLIRAQGASRTALTAGIVCILSWALEAVGATGFPFGAYHYTDRLQPQVAHVPLLIPAA